MSGPTFVIEMFPACTSSVSTQPISPLYGRPARCMVCLTFTRACRSGPRERSSAIAASVYRTHGPLNSAVATGLFPPRGSGERDSLEYFLTERYCLYAVRHSKVYRTNIHHAPWPLQTAGAEIDVNTMAQSAGIELPPTKPLLHFARSLEVLIWLPERA